MGALNTTLTIPAGCYLAAGWGAVLSIEASAPVTAEFLGAGGHSFAAVEESPGVWVWRLSVEDVASVAGAHTVRVWHDRGDLPLSAGPVVWVDGVSGLPDAQRLGRVVVAAYSGLIETEPGSGLYTLPTT